MKYNTNDVQHKWNTTQIKYYTNEIQHKWNTAQMKYYTSEIQHKCNTTQTKYNTNVIQEKCDTIYCNGEYILFLLISCQDTYWPPLQDIIRWCIAIILLCIISVSINIVHGKFEHLLSNSRIQEWIHTRPYGFLVGCRRRAYSDIKQYPRLIECHIEWITGRVSFEFKVVHYIPTSSNTHDSAYIES